MSKRIENPAGTVPVLLMNPDERSDKMARARRKTTTRRKTTRAPARRRRAPARAANPRRRRRRAAPKRRRRVRRKRNPKFDLMGSALALLGGTAIGGGAYALDGQDLTPNVKNAIVGVGGLALGIAVSGFNAPIGCGIAGAGGGLAMKALLEQFMAAKANTAGMGRIPGYAYSKFGATPQQPGYYHLPGMDAVQAQLSGGGMDAVVADFDAVQAELIGVG